MSNLKIDVSIIIVNYKSSNLVFKSVDALYKQSKDFVFETIIVDNTEGLNEYNLLREYFKNEDLPVKIIHSDTNLGFGKANNLGAKYASGDFLYFLNGDTLIINNAIYELFDFIKGNDKVGVVGSNLYSANMKANHSFYKKPISLRSIKKDNSIIGLFRKAFLKRKDFNYSEKPLKILGHVCGASLMIRKSLFDQLGGFDKDIFLYAEEALLCYRVIHETGYSIYNIPSSKIIHYEGGSDNVVFSSFKTDASVDGNYIYFSKVYGTAVAHKYLVVSKHLFKKKEFLAKSLFLKTKGANYKQFYDSFSKKLINIDSNKI